jgi:hypothetical protein
MPCPRSLIFSLSIVFLCAFLYPNSTSLVDAQAPVGQWADQLFWGETIGVAVGADLVYGATPRGVFSRNSSGELSRITKAEGLSGSDVSSIGYIAAYDALVIGYASGFVDVWVEGIALPFPDIAESGLLADKAITRVISESGAVLLCTAFGVVNMNIERMEVADTWTLGSTALRLAARAVVSEGDDWLVATSGGLFRAPQGHAFLGDPATWIQTDCPGTDLIDLVRLANGTLIALEDNGGEDAIWALFPGGIAWTNLLDGTVEGVVSLAARGDAFAAALLNDVQLYDAELQPTVRISPVQSVYLKPQRLAFDALGGLWIANKYGGLLYAGLGGGSPDAGPVFPTGPGSNYCTQIAAWNDNVWVATGGTDAAGTPLYIRQGFSGHVNGFWQNIDAPDGEAGVEGVNDPVAVAIDPTAPEHVVFASLEEGLIDIRSAAVSSFLNPDNSGLAWNSRWSDERCTVRGLDFDRFGNLWLANEGADHPLKMFTGDAWIDMEVEGLGGQTEVRSLMATWGGQIWLALRNGGVLVYETAGTPADRSDDDWRFLTTKEDEGGLPSLTVLAMEEDLDGEVWVGTLTGPAVFYQPSALFSVAPLDAQQLLILQDGNYQYLLETEAIQGLTIDGGNRKWLSTQSGAFLISSDGLTQIAHFTSDNSPLLDNDVYDIAIDHASGTVYFGTRNGVISYRGTATNFVEEMDALHCFPNPLHPVDPLLVTVDGLAYDSQLHITTIDGRLVHKTSSEGGRATWDTRDLSGGLVPEGVYLIFAGSVSTTGGGGVSSAASSKILILR